jgi:hypothetical protein
MRKSSCLWMSLMLLCQHIHASNRPDDYFSSIDEYNRNLLWVEHDDSSSREDDGPIKSFQSKLKRPDHYFVPLAKNNNPLWGLEHLDTGERRGPPISEASRQRKRPRFSFSSTTTPSNSNHKINMVTGGSNTVANPEEQHEKLFQFRPRYGKVKLDLGERKPTLETRSTARRRFGSSSNETYSAAPTTNNRTATENTNALTAVPNGALSKSSKKSYINNNQNVEISCSVDPASFVRLGQVAIKASVSVVGAFAATLRLLGPMIVARRALTTVGYVCYDYYNGRYLRTTYNRHWERYHRYEIPSVLRACGRSGVQLLAMGIAVPLAVAILNRLPCWMPELLCHYWYGTVCLGIVLVVVKFSEPLVSAGVVVAETYFLDVM